MLGFGKTRLKIHEFRNWFLAEFGGIPSCVGVQGRLLGRVYNLMDPQELQEFATTPGIREKCSEVQVKAALKVAEMLSRGDIP